MPDETGPGRTRLPDVHLKISNSTNQTPTRPAATTEAGEAINHHQKLTNQANLTIVERVGKLATAWAKMKNIYP